MVWHLPNGVDIIGLAKFKEMNSSKGGAIAFPDYQTTILDLVSEGDKVAARYQLEATHKGEFMGVKATNKKVSWLGFAIYRITNKKLVECWALDDGLGLAKSLGVTVLPK